jgi:hypothetical protein
MRWISLIVLILVVAVVSTPVFVQAQNAYGTILGTVTDSAGAVVSAASVTVTNVGMNLSYRLASGSEGNYFVPNLIPGTYTVTIQALGFKKLQAVNLVLLVDQKLRVDARLQPGEVTTVVEVTDTNQLINTDSSTLGKVVENKQIVDLPLVSRNFLQLVALSPGTVPDTGPVLGSEQANNNGSAVYIGGSRAVSNAYTLDGVDNNDPSFQTPTISPSIDSIQEFKMLNKGYSAEYGSGAAQINLAIKSGSNNLHGTAYEFLRNDSLTATNYFAVPDPDTGRTKPVLRYNQFGYSLGGPAYIPHLLDGRNKLFFFTSYEGTRIRSSFVALDRFPTTAELGGDFSADLPIYDPQTGLQFPGNVIPSTRLSAKSQQVVSLGLFGKPNVPQQVGFNTTGTLANPADTDKFNARGDAKLGGRDVLFGRFSWSHFTKSSPSQAPLRGRFTGLIGYNVGISLIHTFTPSLINEFRVGYNRPVFIVGQEGAFGQDIAGELFHGTDPTPITFGPPTFNFNNYSSVGSNDGPTAWYTNSYSLNDTLTWGVGKHTFKFGADIRKVRYFEAYFLRGRGELNFNGSFSAGAANPSGNALADFVLGQPSSVNISQGDYSIHMRFQNYDGFIQDDWKVFPRLTLNLGLRYEYQTPLHDENNRIAIFDDTFPGGRVLVPNQPVVDQLNTPLVGFTSLQGLIRPDRNNFGPRLGFAYRPFDNNSTVINGGYGLVYDHWELNENIFDVFGPPWQRSFSATAPDPIDYENLFPVAPSQAPQPGSSVFSLDPNNRTPYSQEWNLTLERELKSNWFVQLGYQGSSSSRLSNRNVISQDILLPDGNVQPNPWDNFGFILRTTTNANSNYNAGTALIEKRFKEGYYFQAHYTYSKALGINSATCGSGTENCIARQNYWDPKSEYGPLSYDLTQRFVFSGIWELPFGRGKRFAHDVNGVVDKLVGGWQLNGLYQIQSGFPYSVYANDASGTGAAVARADLVGDPYAKDSSDPNLHNPRRAFNRFAFAQPQAGTFGNSARNLLRGAGLNNVDFSVFKNTLLTERLRMQFRAEFFNVFNHTQFGTHPDVNFSLDPNSTFGLYGGLQHDPRVIQFALKFLF